MYNGIGLSTARGTGTNGYVQRNLSFVRVTKEHVEYKPDEEMKKLDAYINRKGNAELLKHDRLRKIELKCIEMQDLMEEKGYPPEEIEEKVQKFREQQLKKHQKEEDNNQGGSKIEFDEFGKPIARESHQIAEANELKNRKLREAFGLGEFDPAKKAVVKEQHARDEETSQVRNKKYHYVDEDAIDDDIKPYVNPARREKDERPVESQPSGDNASKKKKHKSSDSSSSSEESDDNQRKKLKKEKNKRHGREEEKRLKSSSSSKARDNESRGRYTSPRRREESRRSRSQNRETRSRDDRSYRREEKVIEMKEERKNEPRGSTKKDKKNDKGKARSRSSSSDSTSSDSSSSSSSTSSSSSSTSSSSSDDSRKRSRKK